MYTFIEFNIATDMNNNEHFLGKFMFYHFQQIGSHQITNQNYVKN